MSKNIFKQKNLYYFLIPFVFFCIFSLISMTLAQQETASDQQETIIWQEPTATPPNDNVPAPINVGSDFQTKKGKLGVNILFLENLEKYPSESESAENGVVYYNKILEKFRCLQGGVWVDCIGGGLGVNYWQLNNNNNNNNINILSPISDTYQLRIGNNAYNRTFSGIIPELQVFSNNNSSAEILLMNKVKESTTQGALDKGIYLQSLEGKNFIIGSIVGYYNDSGSFEITPYLKINEKGTIGIGGISADTSLNNLPELQIMGRYTDDNNTSVPDIYLGGNEGVFLRGNGKKFYMGSYSAGGEETPSLGIYPNNTDSLFTTIGYNDFFTMHIQGSIEAGHFNSVSDIALKKDVQKLDDNMIGKVMQLNPVTYRWKEDSEDENLKYGLIAQELEKIFPDMVFGKEGEKTISYDSLIPVLIKSIQEQQQEIEQLKKEIQSLKNN